MITGTNDILALIPQNKEGELVLKEALFFQEILGMRLFVLNILNPPLLFSGRFQAKKLIGLKNEALEELKTNVKNVIQKEIPKNIISKVKVGKIIPTLINESKRGGYQFIIIDKSKSSFKGPLHKTRIDKLISKSGCPVLTVNKFSPVSKIKKIIIPIDISQSTKKRLLWATYFAKKNDAKIQIVSALNIDMDENKSLAFKNADKIKNLLNEREVECEIKILKVHKQKKEEAILNYIEEEQPDLVIIRTHQNSLFAETRIGNFVSGIVHGCKIPVFTVNN